ncbi:MAG: putative Ig domain-containing protein [Hyphomicrobiaceae bacterium]
MSSNMVTRVVGNDLHGKLLVGMDQYVEEKSPGDSVSIHARDAAMLDAAGLTEATLAVANTIPDQAASTGGAFSYTIPANTFSGGKNNVLTATKGDGTALPGWLSFNATTRVVSAATASTGTVAIKIKATSRGGQEASDTFNLVVS